MNTTTGRKGASLRFKLLVLSLGITGLFGGASLAVLRRIMSAQETAQLNRFEAYAQNLGDAISAQFFERYGDVQAFALNPDVRSTHRDVIVSALNAYSIMYGIYDLIMVVDASGKLVAVNSKAPDGSDIAIQELYRSDFSDAPWFKAVMKGAFTADSEKGFAGTFVEDVQVDPWTSKVFGAKRLGSSFSAAIKDSKGQVVGVITNRAGSRWFEVAFRELYAGLKKSGYSHSELVLLDKVGTIAYEFRPDHVERAGAGGSSYDWDSLLKKNLAKSMLESAKLAMSGQSGSIVENHYRSGETQIVGFAPISSQKFIDQLGWSVMVLDPQKEAMASLRKAQELFYGIFAVLVLLSGAIAWIFSIRLSRTLAALAGRLSQGSQEVLTASQSISKSSGELSDAATEQASAIQETTSAIDEVSSMVKKSADNASESQRVSQSSRQAAEQGQQSVQEMMQAINDISQSNAAIMTQVEDGNRQISEIVKVIAEIGNKTKVINDIVFQTKLLSFNASVEAARAGEHGKGFAVVAEEVGNLAHMSGSAAKEISEMLESSIRKVEGIVSDTKTRVERLVVEGRYRHRGGPALQRCAWKHLEQRSGSGRNGR
jgi:methyl-accepting chemotaxis protein